MTVSDIDTFLGLIGQSGLIAKRAETELRAEIDGGAAEATVQGFATRLVGRKLLTDWQAGMLQQGHTAFFLGKYKLLSELGRGGMGVVFKAEQSPLGRIVALKVMNKGLIHDEQAVARFRREIQAAAALTHPNVVTAFDAAQAEDTHFLVMEYVEGEGLDAILKREERLPVEVACEYIRQAAAGLQHAFERGMVHRDIKPGNLLVARTEGRAVVKILDMGLACFTTSVRREGELTVTGQIMGTPDYISPEQARDTKSADIRSDIYSLGCTLFRALTGHLPFEGQNVVEKLMARALSDAPPLRDLLPEAPPELEDIVGRMLARDPAQRYQTPAAVVRALAPFSGDSLAAERFVAISVARPHSGAAMPANLANAVPAQADPDVSQFLQDLAHDSQANASLRTAKITAAARGRSLARWLAAAAAMGLLVALVVWEFRGRAAPGRIIPNGKKNSVPSGLSNSGLSKSGRAESDESHRAADEVRRVEAARVAEESRLEEERRAAEARQLARDQEDARRRDDEAEQSLPAFVARAQGPAITFAELARELTAFNARHGGTRAAARAAELLAKLPSPLDRLESHDRPQRDRDHWQTRRPEEVVGVLGDPRRKATSALEGLAVARDGRFLAAGSIKAMHLIDPRDGRIQKVLPHGGFVLAFAPDGTRLASVKWPDQDINLWDLAAGQLAATLRGHTAQVWSLAFAPDGKSLVSAGQDATIRLWNVATGKERWTLPALVGFGYSHCVAISPDGETLVATATENTLQCRTLAAAELQRTLEHPGVRAVAWSPRGDVIVSASSDGAVKVWDALTGRELAAFQGADRDADLLRFDPDGRFLAVGQTHAEKRGTPAEVRLFEVGTWKPLAVLPHEDQLTGLTFSHDGRLVFTAQWGNSTLRQWDVETGTDPEPLAGHFGEVSSVVMTPDAARVVTGGADRTIRLWDAAEGIELRRLQGFQRGVNAVAISPDGLDVLGDDRFTRWGPGENGLRLCELATGAEVRRFAAEPSGSNALAISPDGRTALSAGNSLWLWDVASGKNLRQLEEGSQNVSLHSAAFSPDGKRALCAGEDGIIRMWDITDASQLRRFEGHAGAVWSVTFTPDGRQIVSAGADGTVRLWDLDAAASAAPTILPHAGPVVAAISADGRTLAAAGRDGRIAIWRIAGGSDGPSRESAGPGPDDAQTTASPADRNSQGPTSQPVKVSEFELSCGVHAITFAPDCRHLVTANENGTVYILRIARRP